MFSIPLLSWKPILEYIDNKFEEYLNAEGHVNRSTVVDNRVHCCLYFISPGHGYVTESYTIASLHYCYASLHYCYSSPHYC